MGKNLKIIYQLSENAQKKLLLQNLDARKEQVIEVRVDDYPHLLEMCSITEEGKAILDTYLVDYDYKIIDSEMYPFSIIKPVSGKCFEDLMTEESILRWINESSRSLEEKKKIAKRNLIKLTLIKSSPVLILLLIIFRKNLARVVMVILVWLILIFFCSPRINNNKF